MIVIKNNIHVTSETAKELIESAVDFINKCQHEDAGYQDVEEYLEQFSDQFAKILDVEDLSELED